MIISQKIRNVCFLFILAALLAPSPVCLAVPSATVQPAKIEGVSDLSSVNWDEEERTGAGNLTNQDWDEEESNKTDGKAEEGLQTLNQEEIRALDSKERLIHISGFFLFVGYILGGILTAFLTRNRLIASRSPPELLILLHTFWPIELVLLLFWRKPVR